MRSREGSGPGAVRRPSSKQAESSSEWLSRLTAAIDGKDADAFVEFLTDDAVFVFGNASPVAGKEAVRELLVGFFASIRALHHAVTDSWSLPRAVVAIGRVTYTRHDGSTLEAPFADVLKTKNGLVSEYLIYVDASRLYAP